jgi:hypothetical protein
MHEHVDYTQSFAVQKFLAVVSKTNKGYDVRKQITISLVKQIIEALPTICSSYIEAIMFASIFSLAFFGFVENSRSSLIWNIRSYFITDYIKHNVMRILKWNRLESELHLCGVNE